MFPNPQDAWPVPHDASVADYEALAAALAQACQFGREGIRAWAAQWIAAIAVEFQGSGGRLSEALIDRRVGHVADFASAATGSDVEPRRPCALADARRVIARAHGFADWPTLAAHIESLSDAGSLLFTFERAVDAVVSGDAATVRRLLAGHEALIAARSTREHHATLLHYVSANGVEGYRQTSPANAAAIAEMLLLAGAEVDAEAEVYGGGCTTLGLVATSTPPAEAGVQFAVIDVLLRHGARMDGISAGHTHTLLRACLANGQPGAAAYLADRGAPLDLASAAGLGRLDAVRGYVGENRAASPEVIEGYALACTYGRADVVEFLLDHGVEADVELRVNGDGHTGLHTAAFGGHTDVVKLLLARGARLDTVDKTWGTTPLTWGLTGLSHTRDPDTARFHDVVSLLVGAGAAVTPEILHWARERGDPKLLVALIGPTGKD